MYLPGVGWTGSGADPRAGAAVANKIKNENTNVCDQKKLPVRNIGYLRVLRFRFASLFSNLA